MAAFVEFTIDQGATFKTQFRLKNDVGENLNIISYDLDGQIRKTYSSANISANVTCTKIDAANGLIQLSVSSANTANLKFGRYVFDVRAVANTETIRLIEGLITVTPQVTKT